MNEPPRAQSGFRWLLGEYVRRRRQLLDHLGRYWAGLAAGLLLELGCCPSSVPLNSCSKQGVDLRGDHDGAGAPDSCLARERCDASEAPLPLRLEVGFRCSARSCPRAQVVNRTTARGYVPSAA